MAMATQSPQQRAETPPPRRRGLPGCSEDTAAQQQVWSAKPGSENPLTSSPLPRPRDTLLKETKDDTILSPKAKVVNFVPAKVAEDACFSSPKRAHSGHGFELSSEPGLFTSPNPGIPGKENRQPGQMMAAALARPPLTPLKTPSRLPTVQEDGQIQATEEHGEVGFPAWVVQTPTPAVPEELAMTAHELRLMSPPPPGLEDVKCDLPKPTVKSTFIQFVSPLKTFSVMSPPKTEPVNFAPAASVASMLFGDIDSTQDQHDDGNLAMSHSPMPWCTHEQIPFFPAQTSTAAPMPLPAELDPATEPRQKGPVVRLAEFLPDPPSCQVDQAFWGMPPVTSLPVPPMMPGTDASMQFTTGMEGMTGHSSYSCPTTLTMMPDAMHGQQWQLPQQGTLQQTLPLLPSPPMHPTEQIQHLPDAHMSQPQAQLQPPPMHTQLLQPPPVMPPPQIQAPTLQSSQMQPPLTQALPPAMQTEQMFLQQLMQLQMQPPTWPPLQPPQLVAGENVPAPPPQAPMEAPSPLCPSACHQTGVCRCGEGTFFTPMTAPSTSCMKSDEQSVVGSSATAPILLSAAMFPEMGIGTSVGSCQRL